MTDEQPALQFRACDYCKRSDGVIQLVIIGSPKTNRTVPAWLHAECERGYLRLVEDPT